MRGVLWETAAVSVEGIHPGRLSDDVVAAWDHLYAAQTAPANPFLARAWVQHWYATYAAESERVVLVVRRRRRDGERGEVIGIAPMHRHQVRIGPIEVARRLLPVGAGLGQTPLELPGLLAADGAARDVVAAAAAAATTTRTHWSELPLAPGQCWFDVAALGELDAATVFSQQARSRACVVLPLQSSWEQTKSGLKRNVKESIRRSTNRLKKDGRAFKVVRRSDDITTDVVASFLDLHRARAESQSSATTHPDAYADPRHRRLMMSALPELGRSDQASLFELYADGLLVASQLALHAPGTSYVHSSGFKQEFWALGVITYLQAALVEHAIERGHTTVNLSPGPNTAKLRWSEDLWVSNEFAFGAGPRSLTMRYSLFTMLSSYRTVNHETLRHRQNAETAG